MKKEEKEEFFDDCPICRLTKAAEEKGREPTLSKLKEAFQKTREEGAAMGGEWFKNKSGTRPVLK